MSLSIESAVRTCKVDTGWANKVQSDRFENPNLMVCPFWNGVDTAGRRVCPDSFMTKSAGCNSPEDRVVVENNVSRPAYMGYINLNAAGLAGDIYGDTASMYQEKARTRNLLAMLPSDHSLGVTGQFGHGAGYTGETLRGCNGSGSNGPTTYQRTYPKKPSNNHHHRHQHHKHGRDRPHSHHPHHTGHIDLAGKKPTPVNFVPKSQEHYAMAMNHQRNRQAASQQTGFNSYNRQRMAGFRG